MRLLNITNNCPNDIHFFFVHLFVVVSNQIVLFKKADGSEIYGPISGTVKDCDWINGACENHHFPEKKKLFLVMKIWRSLPIMGEAQIPIQFMSIPEAMALPLTFVLKMNTNLPLWAKLKILHENGLT